MIHHVVLMRFTDPANASEAKRQLESLVGQVPQVTSMDVRLDSVGADGSYHVALTTTHHDVDALRGYQQHPAHLEVASWLRARLADRAVVDWQD